MEGNRIDFTVLRRLAPGRFSEDMLAKLAKGVHVDDFKIQFLKIELGEDPSTEKLDLTFFVELPHDKLRRQGKAYSRGPKLFFTLSSEATVDENLHDLKEFVRQHADTASKAPQDSAKKEFLSISHSGD